MAKLRCCDITFSGDSMAVHIQSSKSDQYRQGDKVIVVRTGSPTCPVAMLERYYSMASLSRLVSVQGKTKHGERLRASGSLSYTRMRELFLDKLKELGFDASKFGLHSLRSLRQLMQVLRIAYLNGTAGGDRRWPRMAISKILGMPCCQIEEPKL